MCFSGVAGAGYTLSPNESSRRLSSQTPASAEGTVTVGDFIAGAGGGGVIDCGPRLSKFSGPVFFDQCLARKREKFTAKMYIRNGQYMLVSAVQAEKPVTVKGNAQMLSASYLAPQPAGNPPKFSDLLFKQPEPSLSGKLGVVHCRRSSGRTNKNACPVRLRQKSRIGGRNSICYRRSGGSPASQGSIRGRDARRGSIIAHPVFHFYLFDY